MFPFYSVITFFLFLSALSPASSLADSARINHGHLSWRLFAALKTYAEKGAHKGIQIHGNSISVESESGEEYIDCVGFKNTDSCSGSYRFSCKFSVDLVRNRSAQVDYIMFRALFEYANDPNVISHPISFSRLDNEIKLEIARRGRSIFGEPPSQIDCNGFDKEDSFAKKHTYCYYSLPYKVEEGTQKVQEIFDEIKKSPTGQIAFMPYSSFTFELKDSRYVKYLDAIDYSTYKFFAHFKKPSSGPPDVSLAILSLSVDDKNGVFIRNFDTNFYY